MSEMPEVVWLSPGDGAPNAGRCHTDLAASSSDHWSLWKNTSWKNRNAVTEKKGVHKLAGECSLPLESK